MVVVEFDYEEFKDIFKEPKEKVIEVLNKIGAPAEVDPETGKIFVEITPNRPDWYSVVGLARGVRAFERNETKKYKVKKGDYKVFVDKKTKKIRPYTACAVVKGLKLTDREIRDIVLLQEKLLFTLGRVVKRFGIGVYPLEKLNFPLYYTTMKPDEIIFHPLNYPTEANAKEILERHPKGQSYGGIIVKEKEYPVYLDANKKIMALIPIINSEETGKIDITTTGVFIEVTGVDKVSINQALNIIVCHLVDLGGEAYTVDVEYSDKKMTTPLLDYKEVKVNTKKVKKVLGIDIDTSEIKKALNKIGYYIDGEKILAQPYRVDIISDIDVIEDIAIAHGYENFEPTIPDFFYPGKKNNKKLEIDGCMSRMGFTEVITPILTNDDELSEFETIGMKVLNPKTKEYTTVRSTMFPSMLEVIEKNKMAGLPQMFYEVGIVVDGEKEKNILCLAVVDKKVEFEKARGYLQVFFKERGWKFELKNKKYSFFEEPYSMDVFVDGKKIGRGGKLSKSIRERHKLNTEIFMYEIEV